MLHVSHTRFCNYCFCFKMAQLEGENLAIKSYKSTIDGLEIDKKTLQRQLKEMEKTLHDVSNVVKTAESTSTGW